jgi:hypothetical protein
MANIQKLAAQKFRDNNSNLELAIEVIFGA